MKPSGPTVSRDGAGFSLLEMLLVISLLAISLAMVAPSFSDSATKVRLERAVDNLVYTVKYAQARAITRQSVVRIVFNESGDGYWLEEEARPGGQGAGGFRRVEGRAGKTMLLSEVSVDGTGQGVSFFPDGTSDNIRIRLCYLEKCFLVSNEERRGRVEATPVSESQGLSAP